MHTLSPAIRTVSTVVVRLKVAESEPHDPGPPSSRRLRAVPRGAMVATVARVVSGVLSRENIPWASGGQQKRRARQ